MNLGTSQKDMDIKMKDICLKSINLYKSGMNGCKISRELKVHKSIIYKIIKRYNISQTLEIDVNGSMSAC